MKIGILAFGSLIDDPGEEIANVISGGPLAIKIPFPVEYGRFSLSRGGAPTLVPHASGGSVTAQILHLTFDCSKQFAMDILWRREIRSSNSSRKYSPGTGANAVLVKVWRDFHDFDEVFYTDFNKEGKCFDLTAGKLASSAIDSVGRANPGKDGISYLINNIRNGIITSLTLEYETSVLALTRASSLEEALEISKNSKGSGINY
jgi:hypothetical protein